MAKELMGDAMPMSCTEKWYALHVRSRHEFVTCDELRAKGVETFLPSTRRLSQWKDRKKHIDAPLFPGYLFVHLPPQHDAFMEVLSTRGVVTLLSTVKGSPTPVPEVEITSLRLLTGGRETIDIYPHLRVGANVRIKHGVFKGVEGTLSKKEDHYMLLVNIRILGRCAGVKVYAEDVEAA